MEQNNLWKFFSLFAFLAFAAVSCWATTESLHLLLPNWPLVLCWIVTIGFFIIASLGTKMIVDSLNQDIYLEKRGIRLIGGVLLVIIFWIFCSMPTNTHTFFYRSTITDVATQDLSTTKSYLQQLRDNIKTTEFIKKKSDQLDSDVNALITALDSELEGVAFPGFGKNAKAILDKIANTLQVSHIPTLAYKSTSPAHIRALKQQYHTMIYELLNKRKQELAANYSSPQEKLFKPEATMLIKNIETMEEQIANMGVQGKVDNNIITQADIVLKKSYAVIRSYADFIAFRSEVDKNHYLANDQVTKVSRMLSVIDVWKDYFTGRFTGRGFLFWIIVSILVDVAAFIFFDIAFKKREY